MKLKKNKKMIKLFLTFLLILNFLTIQKVNAVEKNYVVATVDDEPITYIDLKERAKLIYYSREKSSDYKNINVYFQESLEKLINDKLIFNEALKYNKDIMSLSYIDSKKYLLSKFSNSKEKINQFLKSSGLDIDTILYNYQSKLAKKFLIQIQFKNELKAYNEEVEEDLKKIIKLQNLDQIDFEEIVIKFNKIDKAIEKKIIMKIKFLLDKLATFKEILTLIPPNNDIKLKGGRVGWKNINQVPKEIFNKFSNVNEGEILQIKSKNMIKLIRVLAKRSNGILSDREKQISLLKIEYEINKNNVKKRLLNLKQIFLNNKKQSNCTKINNTLNKTKTYKSRFFKVRIADLNEKIIQRINKSKINQLINPFYFNNHALAYYVCDTLMPRKIKPNKTKLIESLFEEKTKHLTLRLLKKLKKDSDIVIKKDFK